MAKYTTQIRSIVESNYPIFDFDYPLFDPSYKPVLEKKIIDHYYFREIGLETVEQFKWFLKDKLNRIMPYYNQLYNTEGLITKDDYWANLNTVEKHTRTKTEDVEGQVDSTTTEAATATSTIGSDGKEVFSDTPQGKLSGLDYATNMTEHDSSSTNDSSSDSTATGITTNTGKVTTTEEYIMENSGGGGMRYNADILMEWRKSFLNIDQMVIDELNDLFMNIY